MLSAAISSACCILHLQSLQFLTRPDAHSTRDSIFKAELVKISKISFLPLYLKMRRAEAHTVSQRNPHFDTALQCFVFGSLHSNTRSLESRQNPRSIGINAAASTHWVDILKCWEDHDKISQVSASVQ